MPDSGADKGDARTSPSGVWKFLESLRGDDLAAWRTADVPDRPPADARNLTEDFPLGWFAVAWSDELAAGEVKPLRYFGRDLVAWRGEDGQARVLDAYCRHLGAHLGYGGQVRGNDIECPFHAWRYGGDGAVTAIPYARTMPPRAGQPGCLASWPVRERNGFVWVWRHPHGAPPLFECEALPELVSPDWTVPVKQEWRIFTSLRNIHDNGLDLAHFIYLHRTTGYPEADIDLDGHRLTFVVRAPMGTPKGVVQGVMTNFTDNPGNGWIRFQGISETLLISSITPVERDEVHVRFLLSQPKAVAEGPLAGLARAMIREVGKQQDQDKVIWDRQRYQPEPIICDGDGPIPLLRGRYDQFMSDEAFARARGKRRQTRIDPMAGTS